MAAVNALGLKFPDPGADACQYLGALVDKMKPADQRLDPVLWKGFPGRLDNIAYTAVRAAGYDAHAVFLDHDQRNLIFKSVNIIPAL